MIRAGLGTSIQGTCSPGYYSYLVLLTSAHALLGTVSHYDTDVMQKVLVSVSHDTHVIAKTPAFAITTTFMSHQRIHAHTIQVE